MKRAIPVLAILLALAVAAYLLIFEKSGAKDAVIEHGESGTPAPREAARAEVAAGAASRARQSDPATASDESQAVRTEAKGEGIAIVTDPQGVEHASESGTIQIQRAGAGNQPEDLSVTNGHFKYNETGDGSIYILTIILSGRVAFPESAEVKAGADGRLVVRARWPSSVMLRVVDRDSGKDLTDVLLLSGSSAHAADFPVKISLHEIVVSGKSSPVEIPAPDSPPMQRAYWARAPGHAFNSIEIDHTSPGERILALDPAASLSVVFDKTTPFDANLRLYKLEDHLGRRPQHEEWEWDIEVRCGRQDSASVSDLAAGKYKIEVGVGRFAPQRTLLATSNVILSKGAFVTIHLHLEDMPAATEFAPFSGILKIPAEWQTENLQMTRTALDEAAGLGGQTPVTAHSLQKITRSSYSFDFGRVAPGKYGVKVKPPGTFVTVEIPRGGRTDLEIVIPPPATLLVRVLDEDTGEPVPDPRVTWSGMVPDGVSAWEVMSATWNEEKNCYVLRAPVGPIEVTASVDGYAIISKNVEMKAGTGNLTITTSRVSGVEFVFRDGTALVPVDSNRVSLRGVSHDGEESYRSSGAIFVTKPGIYEAGFMPVPGFVTPSVRNVDIKKGEIVKIEVPLVREH